MNREQSHLLVAFGALTLSMALSAQESGGRSPEEFVDDLQFSEWDADGDRMLSKEEWRGGFEQSELFFRLDQNDNLVLGGEEINDAGNLNFDLSWDENENGAIERGEAIDGLFLTYDIDEDDRLSETDFALFTQDAGLELSQL